MHNSHTGRESTIKSDPDQNIRKKVPTNWTRMQTKLLVSLWFTSMMISSVTCSNPGARVPPSHYTEAHRELHRKIRTTTHKHVEDFEIVIPSLVDENYRHISHNVRHRPVSRVRRDVSDDIINREGQGLRYALSGFGHNFRLHLKANNRLLAPTFFVKRVKRGAEEIVEESRGKGCHYHGRMTSHSGGMAALSTCDGLTGLMRTEEDDFIVEPVASHVNHSFTAPLHPHVIYKRRHLEKGKHRLHYCGKKYSYPVTIPTSGVGQTIKVLSNGEIELEEESSVISRRKRSVLNQRDFDGSNVIGTNIHESRRDRPPSKNVETLVVADRDMIQKHARDHRDVTTYVLTVMNMVSGLFSDRTLDGHVNIVLVGLMLMEDNQGLDLDHKADRSLANFCTWQSNLNQSQSRKPDHSILLTGIDICVKKNSPCETLGLAQVGGMCSKRDSCTINEDMGLGLAFTVAHETGHSFGMKHDGQSNYCSRRDGHIMSPTLSGLNGVFTWSACSREALNDFLSDEASMCLDNHPTPLSNLHFSNQLPGEMYSGESQCQWQFGIGATLCVFRYQHTKASLCNMLWCQREGSSVCETKYMPAAEGTSCGDDLWCRRGVCVSLGSPGPRAVDGGWSDYGHWSVCTRTCGAGVQYRKRTCNNPAPQYGGRHCSGLNKIFQLCNTRSCPASQVNFREQQCAEFNNRPYRRLYYNWVPFTKYSSFGRDQCELLCKAEGYDFFDMLRDQVIDGTPCDDSSNNVCIQGKCKSVGCDYVLGSNATYDTCGVCNGDNSTCETMTGTYVDDVIESDYYEVVRIPRGARSIRIWEEKCCTHSYIAIKSASDRQTYYLNGNWKIDLYGANTFAGTNWVYNRKAFKSESVSAPGPLTEDIIVEVLIVVRNPGISYSFAMERIDNNLPGISPIPLSEPITQAAPKSRWNVVYSGCSQSCGGGIQNTEVKCVKDDDLMTRLDDEECDPTTRPSVMTKQCSTQPCPPRWTTSKWSQCSKSCGKGLQTRQVTCNVITVSGDSRTRDSKCDSAQKPKKKQKCRLSMCPASWHVGIWSKCSKDCGIGSKRRSVHCRSGNRNVRKSACDRNIKPKRKESCLIAYCQRNYQWFITPWEQCSSTCGKGKQRRELKCSYKRSNGQYRPVSKRRCKRASKPVVSLQKACSLRPCPVKNRSRTVNTNISTSNQTHLHLHITQTARWITGAWEKCSVSCGGGVQTRAVRCLKSGQPSDLCTHHREPPYQRSCNTYQCYLAASQEKPSICEDRFSWCSLVPPHGQCNHPYFGVHCCKSCAAAG